jgi:hypothetical protein
MAVFVVCYHVLSSQTHRVTVRQGIGRVKTEAVGLKGRYYSVCIRVAQKLMSLLYS